MSHNYRIWDIKDILSYIITITQLAPQIAHSDTGSLVFCIMNVLLIAPN